jgi:hypothetical protein
MSAAPSAVPPVTAADSAPYIDVRADEIRWDQMPLPPRSWSPATTITATLLDLVHQVRAARRTAQSYRALAMAAISQIAELRRELRTVKAAHAHLVEEYRALRQRPREAA